MKISTCPQHYTGHPAMFDTIFKAYQGRLGDLVVGQDYSCDARAMRQAYLLESSRCQRIKATIMLPLSAFTCCIPTVLARKQANLDDLRHDKINHLLSHALHYLYVIGVHEIDTEHLLTVAEETYASYLETVHEINNNPRYASCFKKILRPDCKRYHMMTSYVGMLTAFNVAGRSEVTKEVLSQLGYYLEAHYFGKEAYLKEYQAKYKTPCPRDMQRYLDDNLIQIHAGSWIVNHEVPYTSNAYPSTALRPFCVPSPKYWSMQFVPDELRPEHLRLLRTPENPIETLHAVPEESDASELPDRADDTDITEIPVSTGASVSVMNRESPHSKETLKTLAKTRPDAIVKVIYDEIPEQANAVPRTYSTHKDLDAPPIPSRALKRKFPVGANFVLGSESASQGASASSLVSMRSLRRELTSPPTSPSPRSPLSSSPTSPVASKPPVAETSFIESKIVPVQAKSSKPKPPIAPKPVRASFSVHTSSASVTAPIDAIVEHHVYDDVVTTFAVKAGTKPVVSETVVVEAEVHHIEQWEAS